MRGNEMQIKLIASDMDDTLLNHDNKMHIHPQFSTCPCVYH